MLSSHSVVGPRICIGEDFAMMEGTLVIATILRNFRLTLVNEQFFEPLPVVLLKPKSRIMVRLAAH
jgi:cytochrome P450